MTCLSTLPIEGLKKKNNLSKNFLFFSFKPFYLGFIILISDFQCEV